jgi:hypothetical protein
MLELIALLNNNKLIWGATMLLLNIGSRFVVGDLGKFHELVLSNEYVKKIIVFSMFFVATRDIIASFLLTVLYVVIVDGLLHEKRKFCILPSSFKNSASKDQNLAQITDTQYVQAKQVVLTVENKMKGAQETAQTAQTTAQTSQTSQTSQTEPSGHYETYFKNLQILNDYKN